METRECDTPNPFFWRGPVKNREAFIGRQAELRGVFSHLHSLGSVSVVGARRIGKSSLLYQACQRTTESVGSEYCGIYVDMLSATHHTLRGVLQGMLAPLGQDLGLSDDEEPATIIATFEAKVREARAGVMPVVFLDEFEGLVKRVASFGDDVLESWRHLASNGQLGFVTSSKYPLSRLCGAAKLTSSFHNIFSKIPLGRFTAQEGAAFASWAVSQGGFEPADRDFLLRVGTCHPYRLQRTAWYLFEARRSGPASYADIEGLVAQEMEDTLADD